MHHAKRTIIIALLVFVSASYSQTGQKPLNDLPNPYRTVRDWAKPPGGAPWAAVTAIEPAPDEAST